MRVPFSWQSIYSRPNPCPQVRRASPPGCPRPPSCPYGALLQDPAGCVFLPCGPARAAAESQGGGALAQCRVGAPAGLGLPAQVVHVSHPRVALALRLVTPTPQAGATEQGSRAGR